MPLNNTKKQSALGHTGTKYTQTERELTYLLVTELLSHQFCLPVQWIDTQDVFLRAFAAERIIEIGPADTLINMAKKTIDAGYKAHDAALSIERELLSYKKQSDAICYQTEPAPSSTDSSESTSIPKPPPTPEPTLSATSAAVVNASVNASSAPSSIPDKPLASLDILTSLVAFTLKRTRREVESDKTIKQLCGGKSTMQNEIIGDLSKEFGALPEQPEELALADLAAVLDESSSEKKLGPCTNSLVGKFVSTKMPAGSGIAVIRKHLETRWGLGRGLQDSVLLSMLGQQPAGRLGGEEQFKSYLDGITQEVLGAAGIKPSDYATATTGSPAANVSVSPEAVLALQGEQQSHNRRLMEVYAKLCNHDLSENTKATQALQDTVEELQKRLDSWNVELGDAYEKGIAPMFESLKVRKYDSSWNWAIQDLLLILSKFGHANSSFSENEPETASEIALLEARATPRLLDAIKFTVNSISKSSEGIVPKEEREFLVRLYNRCVVSAKQDAVFKGSAVFTAPYAKIGDKGNIEYFELPRPLTEKKNGEGFSRTAARYSYSKDCELEKHSFSSSASSHRGTPGLDIDMSSSSGMSSPFTLATTASSDHQPDDATIPHIKTKGRRGWRRNETLTNTYLQWIHSSSVDGVSFKDRTILITGAGRDSIGAEIVKIALTAGAKVVVTTSSYSSDVALYYQNLYVQHGGRGSQLIVVPFNGGSQRDIQNLVDYIYDPASGLGWDPDHVIPFAAVGEAGRAIDNIDSKSEFAHRVMLTNLVRLLGAIKAQKKSRNIRTHPTQVLLPLSPNHGIFGEDGLYAESKIGLETLLNKWWSEDWNAYLGLCGTVIGWTRGTGLMSGNDTLAAGVEDIGMRTFSKSEMALHIAGLMSSPIASYCELEPLMVDISGGMAANTDLRSVLNQLREGFNSTAEIRRAITKERALDEQILKGTASTVPEKTLNRRARIELDQHKLPDYKSEIEPLTAALDGMVDPEQVVVIVGFGETGAYGNSRTRWEIETSGEFSLEGCLEMAWIMGLIKYHNGPLKGRDYCGWLDATSNMPITDMEVKTKYENHILEHTGIRIVEPQEPNPSDPTHMQFLHEVSVTEDLKPFEVSSETAEDLKREHGDKVEITEVDAQLRVTVKAGATLMVPKAIKLKHAVGAQIPAGWDASIYGIPQDIISQVDPVTLYSLVSTVEAFLSAGITDVYELYRHIHVSDVAICVGSGVGGQESLNKMFKQRFMDRHVQKDILAETFINTTSAWINMLLLGGSGPIRTPVGACATSLESVDTGFHLITSGKAKACLVGGFDGYEQTVASEFANMQATVNVEKETAMGRTPREMSRPMASTRGGFVESEGCGIQLMMTAKLALEMGLPIHGIIALTHTASDKIGRSVPAPGKGLLTIAREVKSKLPSALLKMAYRQRNMQLRKAQIEEKREASLLWLKEQIASQDSPELNSELVEYEEACRKEIEADAARLLREAHKTYGSEFWKGDTSISPLRGALAVWGLTVDDINVASLHGTSTVKNDLNETAVIQQQLEHLDRTKGNILPCVSQKWLTGHAKGAAGAFALNGCFQMMASKVIPGNRNADNIEEKLAASDLLVFPNRSIETSEIKAFSVTSFGFGQKGAQVIGVHPKYLFASLSKEEYDIYSAKVNTRRQKAYRHFQDGFYGNSLVTVKEKSPYEDGDMEAYLINPESRLK